MHVLPDSTEEITRFMVFLIPIVATFSLFTFLAVVGWAKERRREREAFYRHETARRLVDLGQMNAADFALFLEEERLAPMRARREGLRLAGLVLALCGVGFLVALIRVDNDVTVRGIGWIPLGIGLALLVYGYVLGPRLDPRRSS